MASKEPSRINVISVLLVLVFAGIGYVTWKFFPVYWTAWQVDHVLSDGAARAYPVSKVKGFEQTQAREQLVRALRAEVVALGIRDPDMTLHVEMVGDNVFVTCDYREVVVHPIGGRWTLLPMHRKAAGSLQPPKYGF